MLKATEQLNRTPRSNRWKGKTQGYDGTDRQGQPTEKSVIVKNRQIAMVHQVPKLFYYFFRWCRTVLGSLLWWITRHCMRKYYKNIPILLNLFFNFFPLFFIQSKIFVVDSSDSSHLNEAAQSLAKVLRNSTLAGLPLLVLANKQDLSDAKDLVEVLKIAITFYSCYLQQCGSKN